jgi:signal transduction histidine kinase/CheY-like chemotaxis protein
MTYSKATILLVDDEKEFREAMEKLLSRDGYAVTKAASGEEAWKLAADEPTRFEFALIDQVLHPGTTPSGEEGPWDGIKTATEMMKINKDICTIIYSGKTEDELQPALLKGVHRVIFKQGIKTKEVIDFSIQEMKPLRELKTKLDGLNEKQQALGSLSLGLKVGKTLIDRKFRVWHVDDNFLEITGYPHLEAGLCYERFHGYTSPCYDCPAKKVWKEGEKFKGYFLNPFFQGGLKYIYIEAEPFKDTTGNIIGVIKSAIDIEGTVIFGQRQLEDIVQDVLRAVYERGQNSGRDFRLISFYEYDDQGATPFWSWKQSYPENSGTTQFTGNIRWDTSQQLCTSRLKDILKKSSTGNIEEKVLFFCLPEGQGNLGLMRVARGERAGPLDQSDLKMVEPYARFLQKILEQARQREEGQDLHLDQQLNKLRLELSDKGSQKEALEDILKVAMKLTGADMGHIRWTLEDGRFKKAVGKGEYYEQAPEVVTAYVRHSATAMALHSQRPFFLKDRMEDNDFTRTPATLFSIPGDPVVEKIRSLMIMPITLFGKCYGFLKLMSEKIGLFDEARAKQLSSLWHLCAIALREYKILTESQKFEEERNQSEIQLLEMAKRTLHKIRTPATNVRTSLTILGEAAAGTREITREREYELITLAARQLEQIEGLGRGFQRLHKPVRERQQLVDLKLLMEDLTQSLRTRFPEAGFSLKKEEVEGIRVKVDPESFLEVLEELYYNAKKAAEEQGERPLVISMVIGKPGPEDAGLIDFMNKEVVVLRFTDNGPGVPEKIRETIFEPWVSFHPHESSGLGLSIVRKIVEEHGGQIYLGETGKEGTTFGIALPIAEE